MEIEAENVLVLKECKDESTAEISLDQKSKKLDEQVRIMALDLFKAQYQISCFQVLEELKEENEIEAENVPELKEHDDESTAETPESVREHVCWYLSY